MTEPTRTALARALSRYPGLESATVEPLGSGLINETFQINDTSGERFVLQRVNPIFDIRIHHNIEAVTGHLESYGLTTPRLIATIEGEPFVDLTDDDEGLWRLMTFVEGFTFDTVVSEAQARSAGLLVGQFHRALENLEHAFVGTRVGVHDTPRHLERLREAVQDHPEHRLAAGVRPLATEILARAKELEPLPKLPRQICHGDLKLSNILFAGSSPPESERAQCLIDLDTVGPMHLAHELGDAWRSWCNPVGENVVEARFDLDIFKASVEGYSMGRGRDLTDEEALALLGGVEWVTLELAARFAADAIFELYFGWDHRRYSGAGEHNLVRAQGQLALHRAVMDTRSERAALLSANGEDSPIATEKW